MSKRPYFDKARAVLDEAHKACFNHPDRDILGMSHGPFSGVNQALEIIAVLEEYKCSVERYLSDGYRFLAPGQMDEETLEAAAKIADSRVSDPSEDEELGDDAWTARTSSNSALQNIAAAIRALGGGEG